jgi:hypothetical protein
VIALDVLTGAIRGDAIEWPPGGRAQDETALVDAAIHHSVESLLVWQLRRAGTFDRWPERIRTPLAEVALQELVVESSRESEVRRVVSALAEVGVPSLLLKGAALAYSHYPQPWLRPRNDTDLLVRKSDMPAARRVMTTLGYELANTLEGEFVGHQEAYARIDRLGLRHIVEVHWKTNNRPLFADLFGFDELWADAVAVPAHGDHARAPDDAHALILACLHPVSHHRNSDNLLWSYDIHLLASRLAAAEFERVAGIARRKQVAAICAGGLARAAAAFHTPVPAEIMAALDVQGEASAIYLGRAPWRGDVRLSDLRTLPGVRAKLQLIREVALPSSAYILKEYDASSRLLIPALHVYRLARGTWRLLRRFAQ